MKKSALELFVKSFLKTHNKISLRKVYVEKAIALINVKLTCPDCQDIDLKTKFDNELTIGVANILRTVPFTGNKASYERTVTTLEKYIGIGCCEQ